MTKQSKVKVNAPATSRIKSTKLRCEKNSASVCAKEDKQETCTTKNIKTRRIKSPEYRGKGGPPDGKGRGQK